MLLRTARDCGIGNPSLATRLLLRPDRKYKSEHVPRSGCKEVIDVDFLERQLCIQSDPLSDSQQDSRGSEDEPSRRQDSTHLIPIRQTVSLPVDLAGDCAAPNLLDIFEGKTSTVISLSAVKGPSDRLVLIGGATGLLEKMEVNGLSPDLRTLTMLADMTEPGYLPLQVLLKAAKTHKVKLDVAFFNSVIRRAARADDMEGATVRTQSEPSFLCLCYVSSKDEFTQMCESFLTYPSSPVSFGWVRASFCIQHNVRFPVKTVHLSTQSNEGHSRTQQNRIYSVIFFCDMRTRYQILNRITGEKNVCLC